MFGPAQGKDLVWTSSSTGSGGCPQVLSGDNSKTKAGFGIDFQIDCGGYWKQGGSWKMTQMTTGNISHNEGEKREAGKELFERQGENREGRSTQSRGEVCSEVHALRSLRRQRLSPATPEGILSWAVRTVPFPRRLPAPPPPWFLPRIPHLVLSVTEAPVPFTIKSYIEFYKQSNVKPFLYPFKFI